jgi:crotonobetainyl-CoA:carnitine CoA-transferase CaiB-like acyl-CoA transferase
MKRMKTLKLTYTQIKKINPRIIMTSITPFGQTGPYKDYKGGELVNTQMGGVGFISTREPDTSKAPIKYPAHLFSYQAGLCAAVATMAALFYHRGTGSGEQLDISEQESTLIDVMNPVYNYSYTGHIASRAGVLTAAPTHLLPCKDGYIHNGFVRESHWRQFVNDVMGMNSGLCWWNGQCSVPSTKFTGKAREKGSPSAQFIRLHRYYRTGKWRRADFSSR